jgi:hypothetical protein
MIKKLYNKVLEKHEYHKLRKHPSGYGISLFDSIHFVPKDHWSHVADDRLFMQLPYLQVMEVTAPPNMHMRYALVYDGKDPIAACYFQVIELTGESLGTMVHPEEKDKCAKAFSDSIKKLLKKHSGKVSVRLLICGNAFASGVHGFAYVPGADLAKAYHGLADAIYRVRRGDKLHGQVAAVLVKDFYNEDTKHSKELEKFDYSSFLVEPNMIIELDKKWKCFDDYLAAMTSKYRKRAKAIIKKSQTVVRKELSYEEILENRKRIMELYDAVHLKAKFRLASLTIDYFADMKRMLPDNFTLTAYYVDGKMAAFRTTFIDGHSTEAHFVGLDYKINPQHDIYFNMLYDYAKEGIERGVSKVYLGRTASEIKSTLGAKAYDLTCYVRHRNPLSNRIIRPFIDYLKPSEWIPRNPFKDEKEEVEVVEASQ